MWQRFTESARKVVFYAQEEAQKYGDGYISTEHLLLGLTRDPDTIAARVLNRFDVDLTKLRIAVEESATQYEKTSQQEMTLTPRAKRVIDLAYDEARNLHNNYIGTEHLLLGLIHEGDGLAGKVLAKLNVDLFQARDEVRLLQDGDKSDTSPPSSKNERPVPLHTLSSALVHAKKVADAFVTSYEGQNTQVQPKHLAYVIFNDPTLGLLTILKPLNIDCDDVADQILTHCNLAEARANKRLDTSDALIEVFVKATSLRNPPDTAAAILAIWELDETLASVFEEGLSTDLPVFRLRVQAFWDANPAY